MLSDENCTGAGRNEVDGAGWIRTHAVANRQLVIALQRDLDAGEAEAIALALELNADLTLLDETEGRHAAQRQGLAVIGVVGVLLQAKVGELLDDVRVHQRPFATTRGFI